MRRDRAPMVMANEVPGPVCQTRGAVSATPCPSQPQVLKSLPKIYVANKRPTMFMLQGLTCSFARPGGSAWK